MTTAVVPVDKWQTVNDVLTWPIRTLMGNPGHSLQGQCLLLFMTFAFWCLVILIPIIYFGA